MDLLIDIGNTRVKWAWLDGSNLAPMQAAPYRNWQSQDAKTHFVFGQATPERVLVSNVAGKKIANLVSEAINMTYAVQPEFVSPTRHDGGVINAYKNPEQLGVDRWLALQAAWAITHANTVVVAVGTAMTIDVITTGTSPTVCNHLGGQILPGPTIMLESLRQNTSDIAERSCAGEDNGQFFATDTASAVHQGIRNALRASVMESLRRVTELTGSPPMLIITGGASPWVTSVLPVVSQIIPDLVLRGLALTIKRNQNTQTIIQ